MVYSPPIKDASSLVSAFFEKDRFAEGGRFAELHSTWHSIVGDRFAAHSSPSDVVKGILYIEVEHPGWIHLLQFKQAGILESVKLLYPELKLKSILFRLAKDKKSGVINGGEEKQPLNIDKTLVVSRFDEMEIGGIQDGSVDKDSQIKACSVDELLRGPEVPAEVKTMMSNLKKLIDSEKRS